MEPILKWCARNLNQRLAVLVVGVLSGLVGQIPTWVAEHSRDGLLALRKTIGKKPPSVTLSRPHLKTWTTWQRVFEHEQSTAARHFLTMTPS